MVLPILLHLLKTNFLQMEKWIVYAIVSMLFAGITAVLA
jgi:hypothetical protein